MKLGFDTKKYLKIQKKAILERIKKFDSKLYLEFGGKLADDYHAARVLPGFEPDAKLKLLESFKKEAEVIICVNASDVNKNKVRKDTNLSYQSEVEREINTFRTIGLPVCGVVISMYEETPSIREFTRLMRHLGVKVYKHYKIAGYPKDIPLILSKDGLGRNEYVETTKPLVIVTAPGPGSGKMATCLSQLYHDSVKGIKSGYAKYETFPVWDLPLKHPIHLAYEAATLELDDVNMIDPYHFEHYKKPATNYNRDIASFPLLKAIFEKLYGKSPYYSPTDMGVNKIGSAIISNKICADAALREIVRRHLAMQKDVFLGRYDDTYLEKSTSLMQHAGLDVANRVCVQACLDKQVKAKVNTAAMELKKNLVVTGKETKDLTASSSTVINALKKLGKIADDIYLIQPIVLDAIKSMKRESYGYNSRLGIDETLTCLAIQSLTNPLAAIALKQLPLLKGTEMHTSCLIKPGELATLKRLGINVTEQAASYIQSNKK